MLIYYIVWIMLLLPRLSRQGLANRDKFNRHYAVYIFIMLSLLLGLRADTVGTDTSQYAYLYSISEERVASRVYDLGYYLFSSWFYRAGVEFQTYLFIISCFMIGCLVLCYERFSLSLAYSIFIFMTIGLLPMYMSGIRQVMAISLCLLALILLERRKIILSAIIIGFASTFHASAIVFFAVVPLTKLRLSRKTIFLLIVVSAMTTFYKRFLLMLVEFILPMKYASFDLYGGYEINPLLLIIAVLIPLFCVIFDNKTEADNKYSQGKTLLFLMSCMNIVLNMLALNSMYFSRAAYYYVHANSILIPNVIFSQRKRYNRSIMVLMITVICAMYFIISMPDGTLQIDKYRFFWQ